MLNYRDSRGLNTLKIVVPARTSETIMTVSLPTLLDISAHICKNAEVVNIFKITAAGGPEVLTTLSSIAVSAAGALTITDSALTATDIFYVSLDMGYADAVTPTLS